jgi:hypothetical protein
MYSWALLNIQLSWTCGELLIIVVARDEQFQSQLLPNPRGVGCIFVEILTGKPLFPGMKVCYTTVLSSYLEPFNQALQCSI